MRPQDPSFENGRKRLSFFHSIANRLTLGMILKGATLERRNHERHRNFNLIKLFGLDHLSNFSRMRLQSFPMLANMTNISEGGLQFASPRKLKANMVIEMVINLAEKNRQIPVDARVVWIQRRSGVVPLYDAGVSFLNLRHEDRVLIGTLSEASRKKGRIVFRDKP